MSGEPSIKSGGQTSDPKQLAAARKELIALSTNLARIAKATDSVASASKER
jgi:hypothetical protein